MRLAGVNVGKVKSKELEKGASRTLVELELDEKYAPIPRVPARVLRQKTLLGETYVELSPGGPAAAPKLQDGDRLPNTQRGAHGRARRDLLRLRRTHPQGLPGVGGRALAWRSRAARRT